MCGINGIVRTGSEAISHDELLRTRDYMSLRGPDACGAWFSASGEIGLGHRRLAIIDLSPAGEQPMSRENGRYQIVFNGEIYNYRELRAELERAGVQFQSHSDTEVILALYAREGVTMLKRLRGMFALGVWDEAEHRLLLARDPYGIKPLYYSAEDGCLRFASQVKALEAGGRISREPDAAGVVGFLMWGSVPEPFTIRQAVKAVPAGHYLLVEQGQLKAAQAYDQFTQPERATQPVDEAVSDSVRAHLIADVPVAVFLSSGLDSSLITALACRYLPRPPITLTVRFRRLIDTPYDEGPLAAEVARTLGTQHVEQTVSRQNFPGLWPRVIEAMDQPSIDGFNTYVVSQIAHDAGVKVVLSGLGGDELLGGYSSFREVPRWRALAAYGRRVPALSAVWPRLAGRGRPNQPKLRGFLRYGGTLPGAYFLRRGLYLPEELPTLIDPDLAAAGLAAYNPLTNGSDLLNTYSQTADQTDWERVHIMESAQYMRNQLLRDADWASMAHSLELRVPLVDAWLRAHLAAQHFEPVRSQSKAAMVRQIAPDLPAALWTRPKSGFFMPVMDWLDEEGPATEAPRWGRDSRRLARRVLAQFI